MADNILNARIKLKYDTWDKWEAIKGRFTPLAGEVIIYEIPAQTTATGLMPPAVGIKVGNGRDLLKDLPWIQAAAGDVYSWAKQVNKPSYVGSEINATRKDSADLTDTTKQTITDVESWLQSLTDDINGLSGGGGSISTQIASELGKLDVDNDASSTLAHHITGFDQSKTLATLIEQDGYISATFQDILIAQSQVTGLTDALAAKAPSANPTFTGTVTLPAITSSSADTAAATKKYVDDKTAGLTGAMHFIGISTTTITDGGIENPTINNTTVTEKAAGDVVLYKDGTKPIGQEYVWTGTAWELLGDEGSYAIKGSITDSDFANGTTLPQSRIANLSTDLNNKAPKNNPTFTGTVTLPDTTPTADTQAATKKYVDDTVNTAKNNLHQIATSGSIYDIEEGSNTTVSNHPDTSTKDRYLILDCGTAEILID